MAGIIDGLLGAGVGAAGALVNNAMFNRQQQAEQDRESRAMDRETFLMELRAKYAKDQAQFANDLQSGLMDKQAQITKDNAKYNNDLALDGLSDPRRIAADERQRKGAMDDYKAKGDIDMEKWAKQNGITHAQALELLDRQQAGQRSLMNMRLAAKGGGPGGGDDGGIEIGNPDFPTAAKTLNDWIGSSPGSTNWRQVATQSLGAKKPEEIGELYQAAVNVMAANPNISQEEAIRYGGLIARKQLKLQSTQGPDGRLIAYANLGNGTRILYGRPVNVNAKPSK